MASTDEIARSKDALARASTVIEELSKPRITIALSDRAPISVIADEWLLIVTTKIASNLNPPGKAGFLSVRKRWSDVVVYGCTPASATGYVAFRGKLIRIDDKDPADQRATAKAIMDVATELHSIIAGYDCIQALTPQDL
jgi:hypothetical protein